ncbi:MAG TPA: sialidase family protein, partial [Acidimicrobiales bacterium]|nr:sialidase family protein [Acidimicrobiales bacterium]
LVENARGKTGTATEANYPVVSVAADTSGSQDHVYVAFRQSLPQQPTAVSNSMIGVSNDGGTTFAPPVNLNNFSSTSFTDKTGKSYPVTYSTPHVAAGDGVVWAVTGGSLPRSVQGAPSQPLFVGTSTDHGKTFSMKPVTPAGASQPAIQWIPQGGSQGTVLLAYQYKVGQTQGSSDIYFQRSTDAGKTWSPPARLNDDDPNNQTYHLLPNMGVAPNGRVDVVWYDFRNSQSFADDVYYTYSTDNGVTWARNVRATDQIVNRNIGINNNSDVRQPPGVGSSNQAAVIGWSDTRLGTDQTQTQDVFADVVQFKALPSGGSNKTLRYLAAGAAGLAVAGLIVALIALSRRRRGDTPPPPPAPMAREREPVGVS